jgi:squalene-hopene/tetraprenyl-beta-curcumene cyclase
MLNLQMVDSLIEKLLEKALSAQRSEGYLVYPLECDSTITSETILLMHALDLRDLDLEKRLVVYLKKTLTEDGWNRYPGGPYDLSASIKAYFALKCAGESQTFPYMQAVKDKICRHGGLRAANVFTRYTLVQFDQLEANEAPWMPVELILQPRWSPFSVEKFAYWAKAVVIPLSVAMTRNFKAKNPLKIDLKELLLPRNSSFPMGLKGLFFLLDKIGRSLDKWIPKNLRKFAEEKALSWILKHDNKEDGLGGIYTAMEYEIKALLSLGYTIEDPLIQKALKAIRLLEAKVDNVSFMQPCVSPVWDTSIAMHALRYSMDRSSIPIQKGLDWLSSKQLIGVKGDWSLSRPNLKGGGWAFQFNNPFYPDLDDTAMCAWAMVVIDQTRYKKNIEAALEWLLGMQSKEGGFAAFSIDQNFDYLNLIPFADHGALLDPPTEDVTGRVLSFFGEYQKLLMENGKKPSSLSKCCLDKSIKKAVNYLKKTQRKDGSWWGRWGTNFLYGTFSALTGLALVHEDMDQDWIQRGVDYLLSRQNPDGGWGESCNTYLEKSVSKREESTLFHTSIVLIGLLYCSKKRLEQIEKGISYLLMKKENWKDDLFNAPGFPRVFYLKYYGYEILFPLWALGLFKSKSAE